MLGYYVAGRKQGQFPPTNHHREALELQRLLILGMDGGGGLLLFGENRSVVE